MTALAAALLTFTVFVPTAFMAGWCVRESFYRRQQAAAEAERAERERGAGLAAERERRRQRARLEIN